MINLYIGEVPAQFEDNDFKQGINDVIPRSQENQPNSVNASVWNNKLVGRLWIIRPDELPVGRVHNLPE